MVEINTSLCDMIFNPFPSDIFSSFNQWLGLIDPYTFSEEKSDWV